MYLINDFINGVTKNTRIHVGKHYANVSAELTAIASALSSDTTHHGGTIETPPAALKVGANQSAFTNDILHVVNRGKAGNLTPTAMSNAITTLVGTVLPPANTTAPAVTGTGSVGSTLSCTMGIWTNSPTSYAYQWLRGGANILDAEAATYKLVAADSGKSISCMVTASTPGGSASAASNAIACA